MGNLRSILRYMPVPKSKKQLQRESASAAAREAQQKRARDALCGVVPLGHELPGLNAITAAAVAASGDDFIINSMGTRAHEIVTQPNFVWHTHDITDLPKMNTSNAATAASSSRRRAYKTKWEREKRQGVRADPARDTAEKRKATRQRKALHLIDAIWCVMRSFSVSITNQ